MVAIETMVPDFTWLSRHFKDQILLTWVASKTFHTAQVLIQLEKKAEVQIIFLTHRVDVNIYIHRITTLADNIARFA